MFCDCGSSWISLLYICNKHIYTLAILRIRMMYTWALFRIRKQTYDVCCQRRSWSTCASAQIDQGLQCSLRECLMFIQVVTDQYRVWSGFAGAQAYQSLRWSHRSYGRFLFGGAHMYSCYAQNNAINEVSFQIIFVDISISFLLQICWNEYTV